MTQIIIVGEPRMLIEIDDADMRDRENHRGDCAAVVFPIELHRDAILRQMRQRLAA